MALTWDKSSGPYPGSALTHSCCLSHWSHWLMGTGRKPLSPQERRGDQVRKRPSAGRPDPKSCPSASRKAKPTQRWLAAQLGASVSSATSSGKLVEYRGQRKPRRAGSLCRCRLRDPSTGAEAGSPGRRLRPPGRGCQSQREPQQWRPGRALLHEKESPVGSGQSSAGPRS